MATAVQQRRGTTSEHSSFGGLEGEITVDTELKTVIVHDGSGNNGSGTRLAKYSELGATITAADESSDTTCFPVFTKDALGALAPKTDASAYTYNAGTGTLSVTVLNVNGTVTADAYTGSQTISNYVTDTAIDVTEFASYAGKKIIYTGAASTISLPNVVAADIGKSWTIVNAGTGVITVDVDASGTAQQVRHAHAGGVNTSTTDRTIAIGGVVEIICIAEDSSGITNSSSKPNYLIYGGGVI